LAALRLVLVDALDLVFKFVWREWHCHVDFVSFPFIKLTTKVY
jgi:hypothetical protein